jgi:carbon-monoxide dehydrogenase medium subunit
VRTLGRACIRRTREPSGRLPLVHARGQIRPFTLDEPVTIGAALRGLSRNLDARAMAGGIDLVNEMKRGSEIAHVVYLRGIVALRGIDVARDFLTIGAATTHADVERAPDLPFSLRSLHAIVAEIGNVRVRAAGTIGGNIMAGNRTYDWLPILMALQAEICFADRLDAWRPVDMLVTHRGYWRLPERLVYAIRIPLRGSPLLRFNRDLKPVVSVAVCLRREASGDFGRVAIGCACTAPVVRDIEGFNEIAQVALRTTARAVDAMRESVPRPDALAETLGARAAGMFPQPHDDGFASSAYRRQMTRTLIVRALRELLGDR